MGAGMRFQGGKMVGPNYSRLRARAHTRTRAPALVPKKLQLAASGDTSTGTTYSAGSPVTRSRSAGARVHCGACVILVVCMHSANSKCRSVWIQWSLLLVTRASVTDVTSALSVSLILSPFVPCSFACATSEGNHVGAVTQAVSTALNGSLSLHQTPGDVYAMCTRAAQSPCLRCSSSTDITANVCTYAHLQQLFK